jgi:hypothetical protein
MAGHRFSRLSSVFDARYVPITRESSIRMSNRQKLSVALWWNMRRAAREPATAELQRLWQEGIASGPGRFTSIDQIKKEARRRLREAR